MKLTESTGKVSLDILRFYTKLLGYIPLSMNLIISHSHNICFDILAAGHKILFCTGVLDVCACLYSSMLLLGSKQIGKRFLLISCV